MDRNLASATAVDRVAAWLTALVIAVCLDGCRVVGGIFKAGIWVGVLLAVVVVVIVILIGRAGRGGGGPT